MKKIPFLDVNFTSQIFLAMSKLNLIAIIHNGSYFFSMFDKKNSFV
jgi:hypothetical protein